VFEHVRYDLVVAIQLRRGEISLGEEAQR
jgi:hypothetical protein